MFIENFGFFKQTNKYILLCVKVGKKFNFYDLIYFFMI